MKKLKKLLAGALGTRARAARRARPGLEALECRLTPSTFRVNGLQDVGAGSGLSGDLRFCIARANANPGHDAIAFDVQGTIALSGALPALSDDVDVLGPGAGRLTVSGSRTGRVFAVNAGVTATLSGLTIADGRATNASGGGILNNGTLTLTGCTLRDNVAEIPGPGGGTVGGGGIANSGTLTVSGSLLSGNVASVTTASSVATSSGGGIANSGTLAVTGCTLSGNSVVALNNLGGGHGDGGGIFNSGLLAVTGSTLSGNSVRATSGGEGGPAQGYGGGVSNSGTLTLSNSTLSGNSTSALGLAGQASSKGGGVYNSGGLTAVNATLTANSSTTSPASAGEGGGLDVAPGAATAVLHNTLVAGNLHGDGSDDVAGSLGGGSDYNLVGDGTGLAGIADGVNGNQVGSAASPLDPLLGPLADNGGPTPTHALLPGSPAIDAGNNAYATDFDQRGPGFPRVANGTVDVGAFEAPGPVIFHVTSLLDAGVGDGLAGDLRYCIRRANGSPGRDFIAFDVRGTIALTGALPALSDDVDLVGPGAANLTVSANHLSRVFVVNAGATASITGLKIADGMVGAMGSGGGISNSGALTLSACTLSGNAATYGGAVYNYPGATLTLDACTLSGNSATGQGGGVSNGGTLAVSASTLSGNSAGVGGAAYSSGAMSFGASTLSGNSATINGGAVYSNGAATFSACTLSGNSATTGGGAVYNLGALTALNSTLSGNSADDGGGLYTWPLGGAVTLTNVTVTANRANRSGGGGQGGGLRVNAGTAGRPLLHNTLIAGNFNGASGSARDDVSGAVLNGSDYNLIGDGTGLTGLSDGAGGNHVGSAGSPIDALLGPLADNGGPTRTHALLPGSPAQGNGSPAYATASDQRGLPRVIDGRIDIGAYQSQNYPPSHGLTHPRGLAPTSPASWKLAATNCGLGRADPGE